MCHGSPTLDSFQFKITSEAAKSNKDSKEPNEAKQEESTNYCKDSRDSKDFKDFKDFKDCEKKTAEAVIECRLNSSQNEIVANKV